MIVRKPESRIFIVAFLLAAMLAGPVSAEVILQFFNNSWNEISDKIPELAEVGYTALWLPPPQKCSGGLSVGYDLWDPFDLGGKDQRNTVKTRYGTEAELLRLIETAHRFGIRVYFDNIMNHRAFDVPGYNADTPIDIYPGMLPEDFHLRVTEEGFYRKWDNTVNWGSTWEVQYQNLSDLIDIAHETPNGNFGPNSGDTHEKIWFVRHPDNPEYYDFHPTGWVGFGSASLTTNVIAQNENFFKEDVGGYLMRSVRWLIDRTKVDGLRLDAVKHVPSYFFGDQNPASYNTNDAGYTGQSQWQFNMTRGFSDWNNHRDSVFETEVPRDDAMIFGEHMGEPPGYDEYFAAGMRLVDAKIHQTLNDNLGNPWGTLAGLADTDYKGGFQFGAALGVPYAKSHDDDYATRPELHYAINLTRAGLPNIYTDGNRQAETLGQSGGAFPRHANTAYLGQWGDGRIPNLVYIHNHFARGYQIGKWADADILAYERRDMRESGVTDVADGTVLLMLINDDYAAGRSPGSSFTTTFPPGAKLWQYSTSGGNFYYTVPADQTVDDLIIPPGGYFAFSWRSPEESDLWKNAGGKPLQIYQNGSEAGWISYLRQDGPDGDPAFNPYGVSDPNPGDYAYTWYVPRVTSGTNLRFVCRTDGSAYNVMMKLDGGMDLNFPITNSLGDARDNPPALATDVFLGYEQAHFFFRQQPEKFAAVETLRNGIGSAGAETYFCTVGSAGFGTNHNNSTSNTNNYDRTYTAAWLYHDPQSGETVSNGPGTAQFHPAPENAANSNIDVWVKTGYGCDISKVYFYYTDSGASWPEGAGGSGVGDTKVVDMAYFGADQADGSIDWWKGTIPAKPGGTTLRYKIGGARHQGDGCGAPYDVPFPMSDADIARKTKMMGVWDITNFNAKTALYRPHVDYGAASTGLVEGFHVVNARAFLQRDNRAAIYNTFVQPFYYDTMTPTGEVRFPGENDWLGQREYGAVVRTDPTVIGVWYHVDDNDAANDDAATTNLNGNGTNLLGETSWAPAYKVVPTIGITSAYPDEWRFSYVNIPTGGAAVIKVRLVELSSSTNFTYSDTDGHYTTLIRNTVADAPDTFFYFDWPSQDGTVLEAGWEVRVKFSTSLADGLSDDEMRGNFLLKINDSAQGRDGYVITRDAGGGMGELVYAMPDLFNGDSNFLHHVEVSFETAGSVTFSTRRFVKFRSTAAGALVQILDPPEYDSDGQPFKIILPDVASPSSTQRQYTVQVMTDLAARDVWVSFTNSSGAITRIASLTNQLSGTVSVVYGTNLVTGSGTLFESQLSAGNILKISTNYLVVSQVVASNSLALTAPYPGATASGAAAYRIDANPLVSGNKQYWNFLWTNMTEGWFTFVANVDTNDNPGTVEASATRNTRVIFRQIVAANTNDLDDDDDGIYDSNETASTNLPTSNPEGWVNGQVHIWQIYGRTDPLLPDTDGDGLSDGLELGWRGPVDVGQTDTNADTNGDGWRNFQGDLDPPFYNTVPDNYDLPRYVFYDSRTKLIHGTLTDANNPDTDYDGIPDGVEDANRNGWVDGDGTALLPSQDKGTRGSWPDGVWDAAWTETDPNNRDSDGDGAADGHGEDTNFNGRIDGDLNSNRTWEAGELWVETNPLNPDTDGDGLPDGWEFQYGLDPLDDGVVGHTNMRTGILIATTLHGASGDPDSDLFGNLTEYLNGTNPRYADTNAAPPAGSIVIGRGDPLGELTGISTQYQEFTDWTADDCIVLDEYEGDGQNNQGGDVYMAWDGWDSSRDLVAFYARDGGDPAEGGDGKFYFRVDLHDLQANAEQGNLDLYVVVDSGNTGVGEMNLPDDVDTITSCRWEVVVAVYESSKGRVYVDTDAGNNSTTWGQDLSSFGVVARDQNAADGFIDAYFSAELDAVEFSISRQSLKDAGWSGLSATGFNYQVFTTKDGTCNSCDAGNPGAGDIGGRSDIRDAIYNDAVAEDYWMAQDNLDSILKYWIPASSYAGHAKVSVVLHGNQAIHPGSVVQELINDGAGAGYNRPLAVHELYNRPLSLHITPTLASAMEWAKTDPSAPDAWRTNDYASGPAFNGKIARLIQTNIVYLLGSTFSDHPLPYFSKDFHRDNVELANEFLREIYGWVPRSNTVFWTPERVLDGDVLDKILDLGYRSTLVDQMTHTWFWLGRTTALADGGYRINRINGVDCLVMNDGASAYRFQNSDDGLPMALRNLVSRKARSGTQDQVVILFSNWEDFGVLNSCNAYDKNIRWLANRPWVELVAPEQILNNQVDKTWDGAGDAWFVEDRGTATRAKIAHDWLHHATEENYDNWYVGSAFEQSLYSNVFNIRAGVPVPKAYGMIFFDSLITDAWTSVQGVADTNLGKLARGVLHASVFQTAFHNQTNAYGTARFSTGDYIFPDTDYEELAAFSKAAQSQTRLAAALDRVDQWAAAAPSITNAQTAAEDVDLDGENEFLLFNDRLFGVFERIGGRLVGVWVRDILDGRVYQAAGNLLSYPGAETEEEASYNAGINTNTGVITIGAYRTSCLKDWYNPVNFGQYVNDLYSTSDRTNGWRLTSSDGAVTKTVTLAPSAWAFEVQYSLSGVLAGQPFYIRNGFSPNLMDLLLRGQATLGAEQHAAGRMTLENTNYVATVVASVGYGDAGHGVGFNQSAVDDDPGNGVSFYTLNMRNQAQTHQVELLGTNSFAFSLGFRAALSDWDADGMPNVWEDGAGFDAESGSDAGGDEDEDQASNWQEYMANTDPNNINDFLHLSAHSMTSTGIVVRFPTKLQRRYFIHYANDALLGASWTLATSNAIHGTGGLYEWVDDGTKTAPDPGLLTNRFYKIQVDLPE